MTKCKNCGCKTSIEGSNSAITRQVGGKHYISKKNNLQPIELIVAHDLDFIDGNIVKYAIRKKNGESDKERYDKIIHYAELAKDLKCG